MINPIDGSLQVFATPQGRVQDPNATNGVQMWGGLFKQITKLPGEIENRKGVVFFPTPSEPQTYDVPAELQAIDLKLESNLPDQSVAQQFRKVHKTAQLVLKPGQRFVYDLYFFRDLDFSRDSLNMIFEREDKVETYYVDLSTFGHKFKKEKYSKIKTVTGEVVKHHNEFLTIGVKLPSKLSTGWWDLRIVTCLTKDMNDPTANDSAAVINGLYVTSDF